MSTNGQKVLGQLIQALHTTEQQALFKDLDIKRTDTPTIILPNGMTTAFAIDALVSYAEEEEKIVQVHHSISCYPLDGAVALSKVIKRELGKIEAKKGTMFSAPPTLVTVKTGPGKRDVERVLWGRISFASFTQQEELTVGASGGGGMPKFIIRGAVKRKNEKLVQMIAEKVEDEIRANSIYRGKSIRVNLKWIGEDRFNVEDDQPKFMDVSDMSSGDLILNPHVDTAIKATVLQRIANPQQMIKYGIPLGTQALFAGAYGTGKTLAGSLIAKLANDAGWTFLYLDDVSDIAAGLRIADLYDGDEKGVVLFAEDIDSATSGSRTADLNEVLNTIDGVDRKSANTILILTTNHADRINEAMMRAKRISNLVFFDYPKDETVLKFIKKYGGKAIAPAAFSDTVAESLSGIPPAFLEEIVQRAILSTMYETGKENITGLVDEKALLHSYESYKEHIALAAVKEEDEKTFSDHLSNWLDEQVNAAMVDTSDAVEEIRDDVQTILNNM